jgi:hypothetical protein
MAYRELVYSCADHITLSFIDGFRLLYNVEEVSKATTTLDHLYECYCQYCIKQEIFPATKDFVSKVIDKVIPTQKRYISVKKNGKFTRAVTYDGICFVQSIDNSGDEESTDLQLPEFCTVYNSQLPHSLSFSVPTLHTLNGETVKADVLINNATLQITVNHVDINLSTVGFNPNCSINRRNLNAIVTLVKHLRLCRGIPYSADNASLNTPEDWGHIGSDNETVRRLRRKSCKVVVPISAVKDTCISCQRATTYLKRKSADDKENETDLSQTMQAGKGK